MSTGDRVDIQEKVRIARESSQRLMREIATDREQFALQEPEKTFAEAVIVLARGKQDKGLEAAKLYYSEWVSDVHFLPQEALGAIRRGPDKAFLSWLERRVGGIYWLSERAKSWVIRTYPQDALALQEHIWKSELLWAFRQRRPGQDGFNADRTWLLAAMWYRAAAKDSTTWFKKIATRHYERVTEDPAYLQSEQRRMVYYEILSADPLPKWRPLWLDLAVEEFGPRVEDISAERLEAARQQVERDHEAQFGREVHGRLAAMFWSMRTAVMPSMVDVAIEAGWGPQTLVEAEREFVQKLLEQRVEIIDRGGYGYREFASWIRANKKFRAKPPLRKVQKEREREFNRLSDRKVEWLSTRLPQDYRDAYGESFGLRREWRESYGEGGEFPETEMDRFEEAKRLGDLLANAAPGRERPGDVAADRIEHPLRIHYAWFLVNRKVLERKSLAGGTPRDKGVESPKGQ
ncbi:hypothetical protein ACVIGB_000856 [Bradyrhizobium sp. USDA 4341]